MVVGQIRHSADAGREVLRRASGVPDRTYGGGSDAGYRIPRADVENDFLRARRRQFLATLAFRLRGGRGDGNRLVRLDDVVAPLCWRGQRQLGLQTIPVDAIVGTAGARRDFDRHFRPTSTRVRYRWERVALAVRRGEAIPPIEVYRVGSQHF